MSTPPNLPLERYRVYTSLEKSENPRNPPVLSRIIREGTSRLRAAKSPLERGTKIRILAPFPRGLGDLDLRINSNRLVYTR